MSEMNVEEYDFSGSVGAERASQTGGGNFSRRVEFLGLKGDPVSVQQGKNSILVRLVTNAEPFPGAAMDRFNIPWITAAQHYAQTRQKPEWVDKDSNWPAKMGVGCRKDPIFTKRFNGACIVCEQGSKPGGRTWALAVEREQVFNDAGQIIGYRDKQREVPVEGPDGKFVRKNPNDPNDKSLETEMAPAFIVMSMGWKNFFSPLNGQFSYFKTLLDADYLISRTGEDNNDTVYTAVRVGEIMLGEQNEWGLPAGTKYDLTDPAFKARVYPSLPDLRQIIADRVSENYTGRYFVPGYTPQDVIDRYTAEGKPLPQAPAQQFIAQSNGAPAVPNPATPQTQGGVQEPAPEALAALQQRMGIQQPPAQTQPQG